MNIHTSFSPVRLIFDIGTTALLHCGSANVFSLTYFKPFFNRSKFIARLFHLKLLQITFVFIITEITIRSMYLNSFERF